MNDGSNTVPLADEARWRALVEKGLRGRPFADLVATTPEGITIQPLSPAADPVAVGGRGSAPWTRLQRIDHPDPERAAARAIEALQGGADGLVLVCRGAPGARGFGIDPAQLAAVLERVHIDACPIRLETGSDGIAVAEALHAETQVRRIDPALVRHSFGIDPISAMAASGSGLAGWPEQRRNIGALVRRLVEAGHRGPFLAADGRPAHDAGASAASELAFLLASTVASLRLLADAGIPGGTIAGAIEAVLSADADQFMTIAKFRAARLLLRRLYGASGLDAGVLRIHGETSYRMTTRLDPHSNLIRGAIAAFSAGIGGADSLSVLPFTAPFGLAGDAPRRLALDTQSVLMEEANLARVADPASGSGAVEALTLALAETAWQRFQAIEAEGGLPHALTAGTLQERIAEEAQALRDGVAAGSIPIIGTNLFRAAEPGPLDLDTAAPWPDTALPRDCMPLPSFRLSETAESEAA